MKKTVEKTVTAVDIDGRKYEGVPISELTWRPSVYGIVIKGDRILLCKHFGRYNLPGGSIELGESIEAALVREVKEETGIDVAQPRLVAADSNLFKLPFDGHFIQSILMYYACDAVGGELSTDGFDPDEKKYAEMAEWVPLATIDEWQITSSIDFRPYVKLAMK